MTRDQAFKIIQAEITDNKISAYIATALDALGLLNLGNQSFGPRFHKPGDEIEDISRNTVAAARVVTGDLLGEAKITEADLPQPIINDEIIANTAAKVLRGEAAWAARRDRT